MRIRRQRIWVSSSILRLLLFATIGTSMLAGMAGFQAKNPTQSKVIRKNKAPVSNEIIRVRLPKPFEAVLDNGLTVEIWEDHRSPLVCLDMEIKQAGPMYDSPSIPGIAFTTAGMLQMGTKSRTREEIAEESDRLGVNILVSAEFGSTETSVAATGLSDNLDDWFSLFVDIVLNPSFPTNELNKFKLETKLQMQQQKSQPSFLAKERFYRAIYRSHPASMIAPVPASINSLNRTLLESWHKERYVPQNAILGIAGDIRPEVIIPRLRKWFTEWKGSKSIRALPKPELSAAKKVYLIDRPGSVQSTIRIGTITVDRQDEDFIPLYVMNQIVGVGPSGRLFRKLREEKGYTYGVFSDLTEETYPGVWTIRGDVRTEVTEEAITEILKEVRRIRDEIVPIDELEEAKRAIISLFALNLEESRLWMLYGLIAELYGLDFGYWDKFPDEIGRVSAKDVQRVAQSYLNPDSLQIVVVGDGKLLENVLRKFGPIELYNAEGELRKK